MKTLIEDDQRWSLVWKEIAELKNRIDGNESDIVNLIHPNLEDIEDKIAELKQKVEMVNNRIQIFVEDSEKEIVKNCDNCGRKCVWRYYPKNCEWWIEIKEKEPITDPCNPCMHPLTDCDLCEYYIASHKEKKPLHEVENKFIISDRGCYQFIYCNECLANDQCTKKPIKPKREKSSDNLKNWGKEFILNNEEIIKFSEKLLAKQKAELIGEFLDDWHEIIPVKPINSVYTHYSIGEERYKGIDEKWQKG